MSHETTAEGGGFGMKRLVGVVALGAALCLGMGALSPASAEAQDPMEMQPNQVDAKPKGSIGLALIGAEIGLAVPALAGLDETWSLVTFPLVGAVGGFLGGWFGIDNNDHEKVAVAMLATGIALVIPSIVITLAATAYDPEDDGAIDASSLPEEEAAPVEEPAAQRDTDAVRAIARAGDGMFRLSERGLHMSVPGLSIASTYSPSELQRFGGTQVTETHISLFTGVF